MSEVVLQVYPLGNGLWGGLILRDGVEDGGRVEADSQEDIECIAMGAGIDYDRIEELDHIPD